MRRDTGARSACERGWEVGIPNDSNAGMMGLVGCWGDFFPINHTAFLVFTLWKIVHEVREEPFCLVDTTIFHAQTSASSSMIAKAHWQQCFSPW